MSLGQLFLNHWNLDPWALAVGGGVFFIYGQTCRWQFGPKSVFFLGGLALALLALLSPLDFLARGILFSAHMLQHLLLVMAVPPLMLLGLSDPHKWDGPARDWALPPLLGWTAGLGAMWAWHLPLLCDAAASSAAVHGLQTASLLILGTLFWRPIVGPRRERRLDPLSGIVYLFSACVGCSLLGIWISFAPVGLCPIFMAPPQQAGWGLSPATDQQLGGLLMWVPACLIYVGAILGLLRRYYRQGGPAHA